MSEFAIKHEADVTAVARLADDFAKTHGDALASGDDADVFNAALEFATARCLSSTAVTRMLALLQRRGRASAFAIRMWIRDAADSLGERKVPDLPDRLLNSELQAHAAHTDWEHRGLAEHLTRWFSAFNDAFFESTLPASAISVAREDRRMRGWYRYVRDGLGLKYRIGINALYVERPLGFTLEVLAHEMIHEWEQVSLGKARGSTYHSRAFREKAERIFGLAMDKHGLPQGPLPPKGPFATLLRTAGVALPTVVPVEDTGVSPPTAVPRSRSRLVKWSCGCTSVWASSGVGVRMLCDKCGRLLRRA